MNDWKKVWESRTGAAQSLADLIKLDGFDHAAGSINEENWCQYISALAEEIGIRSEFGGGGSLIELGCGAGAFLFALTKSVGRLQIAGVDYSSSLLAVAKKFLPQGDFEYANLTKFSFSRRYDHIVMHSVAHYLSKAQVKSLIGSCLQNANKTVSVLEIPLEDSRLRAEEQRQRLIGANLYREKYDGLVHTYFDYAFFESQIEGSWTLERSSSSINNYAQSENRFGVIFKNSNNC